MASNDPTIHIGINSAESVEDIAVHWPSGATTSLGMVDANRRYQIVENEETLYLLDH